ncbi:hypothetical protein CEXT_392131 [Caerostris extrusa]|uniref:Secreted protein n=1 Tax=Caerostris extrusa TaxID=172846 RepID=A0AAV4P453_CAEEX|nr:hypothetical protein CEXT_392131 [Caerostris extrusa]
MAAVYICFPLSAFGFPLCEGFPAQPMGVFFYDLLSAFLNRALRRDQTIQFTFQTQCWPLLLEENISPLLKFEYFYYPKGLNTAQ